MTKIRSFLHCGAFLISTSLFTTLTRIPSVTAIPVVIRADSPSVLDDVLLFDAPAVTGGSGTTAEIQSYVFKRQIDLGPLTDALNSALSGLGLGDLGEKAGNVGDRLKLFASSGTGGKNVDIKVDGCSSDATVGPTSDSDAGIAVQNVTLGDCGNAQKSTGNNTFTGQADLSAIDLRQKTLDVFPSSPDGFGVISDIDDTVKISNVLDKLKLAKATLIDDPEPVAGMPDLYSSLTKSLGSPPFFYVSGSPYQLYPFLQPFIGSTYSASRGPLFLRNLTLSDLGQVIDTLTDKEATQKFKEATIDRLKGLYPQKKFLMIGDSTEKDPETYGDVFRKYGNDFTACIWIRRVDGADNADSRFASAFQGVPSNKIRVFNDSDISGMQNVDVKGGSC